MLRVKEKSSQVSEKAGRPPGSPGWAVIRLRPIRAYVTHFPVNSPTEAQMLSKQSVWGIISYVREFGREGVSAHEISKSLNIPRSNVYTTLAELVRQGYLSRIPKVKSSKGERGIRYVIEKVPWRKYTIDETFEEALEREGVLEILLQQLKRPVLEALVNAHDELLKKGFGGILPKSQTKGFCVECGSSHEAIDFFGALGLVVLKGVMESAEARNSLAGLGYSEAN